MMSAFRKASSFVHRYEYRNLSSFADSGSSQEEHLHFIEFTACGCLRTMSALSYMCGYIYTYIYMYVQLHTVVRTDDDMYIDT